MLFTASTLCNALTYALACSSFHMFCYILSRLQLCVFVFHLDRALSKPNPPTSQTALKFIVGKQYLLMSKCVSCQPRAPTNPRLKDWHAWRERA